MLKQKNAGMGIGDVDAKKFTIVGYASSFGNIDSHNDIVMKGAFKRTIDHNARRVKTLMHHDPVSIIGKPNVLREDDTGLYTETKVSDTALGRDLLTLVADEVIDEMSIGFIPVKEEIDKKTGVNMIQEVKLVEYSFVTLASNASARVVGLKGLAAVSEVASSMKRMEKALRDGSFVTDEVPEALEFIVKYWRSIIESAAEEVGVVKDNDVVSSESQKGDSPDQGTHQAVDDSADATHDDGVLALLKEWEQENELLTAIRVLGKSLEGK